MMAGDQVCRCFIPTRLIGVPARPAAFSSNVALGRRAGGVPDGVFADRIKRCHGPVPAECEMFLEELGRSNPGRFATPEGWRRS
jgi:hypothetical protein